MFLGMTFLIISSQKKTEMRVYVGNGRSPGYYVAIVQILKLKKNGRFLDESVKIKFNESG